MVEIVIGAACILFRRRLADKTIRSQERFWRGTYTGDRRVYVWVWTLCGMALIGLGLMKVVWPQ